ncbi:MAG TPA: dipeptidase [Anaerolineaceae bacterium]|nr:dipeptidase [Anaerolineaceae bacterium]
MTDHRDKALEYAHLHQGEFLGSLQDFVRIPSVSTDPDHQADMLRAANWLVDQFRLLGLDKVQVFPTNGHPIVYAESVKAGNAPTILIYGHYDVQPVDPVELWKTGPFNPVMNGENLYGRGASDMKGQVIASMKAIESILKTDQLPVNIKFLVEGEEEIGSPNLRSWIDAHQDLLACDLALNPDAGMIAVDVPTIIYALRGLAYFEIRVYGPDHDLHSGVFGGVVHNPAQVLCDLISGMHDSRGRITLPGFYDSVRELDAEERSELARLPVDDEYYRKQTGAPALWGEDGYSAVERIGSRPTLDVNGLLSGFTTKGSKTVIPAWAMAKISMRLVPDQDPKQVHKQLLRYMEEHAPKTVRWEVDQMSGGPASLTQRTSKGTQALTKAMQAVWGTDPVYKREGGSIPVVSDVQNSLHADSVLTGFGLPDDNIHSPNEKLHTPTWFKGIDALIHFFYNLQ